MTITYQKTLQSLKNPKISILNKILGHLRKIDNLQNFGPASKKTGNNGPQTRAFFGVFLKFKEPKYSPKSKFFKKKNASQLDQKSTNTNFQGIVQADGTGGYNSNGPVSVTSITVKSGIVTNIVEGA